MALKPVDVEPVEVQVVADVGLDRRGVVGAEERRSGKPSRGGPGRHGQAAREQAARAGVHVEDVFEEDREVPQRARAATRVQRRLARLRVDVVQRHADPERAPALVEGLLEAADVAVDLDALDRRLEGPVELLVHVVEEVEAEEHAVLRHGGLVLGDLEPAHRGGQQRPGEPAGGRRRPVGNLAGRDPLAGERRRHVADHRQVAQRRVAVEAEPRGEGGFGERAVGRRVARPDSGLTRIRPGARLTRSGLAGRGGSRPPTRSRSPLSRFAQGLAVGTGRRGHAAGAGSRAVGAVSRSTPRVDSLRRRGRGGPSPLGRDDRAVGDLRGRDSRSRCGSVGAQGTPA